MRRLFWLGVGAGVAGVAMRRASKVARALTPAGMADRVVGVGQVIRDFGDDVRAGMAERELELRLAAGLDGGGPLTDENPDDWKGVY
jgi:hypothetical protein